MLMGLVVIAVESAFVLMPGHLHAALAAEILIVSAGGVAHIVRSLLQMARSEPSPFSADLVGRWLVAGTAWLLSIGAGISLLIGNGGGLYLLAFAELLGIAHGVATARSLTVGIGKDSRAKDIMPGRQLTPERPPAGQLAAEEDGSRAVPGQ